MTSNSIYTLKRVAFYLLIQSIIISQLNSGDRSQVKQEKTPGKMDKKALKYEEKNVYIIRNIYE